ncbi:MAG: hypothetical protein PF689_12310 [Deltaproteobacteria bacterium]|jgi:hypothetical protein|nr:hypothetical protein [Deltaproteobacteria bacterium]
MKKSILLAILLGMMFSTVSTGCFWRSRRSRSCYRTKSGRRVCKSKRHGKKRGRKRRRRRNR